MTPLLNIDAGELADEPAELYRLAHVVHVACGGHAGDRESMARVARLTKAAGGRVGAHPSYPDRAGFGRTTIAIATADLHAEVVRQLEALREAAASEQVSVVSMKLHGALYHDANRDSERASLLIAAARGVLGDAVVIVGPAGGALATAAKAATLQFWREGFADRGVRADGSLVPRNEPGALVTDPVAARARAVELVRSGQVETICVHGDTPDSVAIARTVREALDALSLPEAR